MVSSIRMGGLVSGLDTESIIKNLMKAEKAPLNKLLQKKQTEEWRRDQYRSMNSLLLDLRNTTSSMRLQSTYMKKILTSDNDSIASVRQVGSPNASTYNVNVKSLPSEATAASVKFTADQFTDSSGKVTDTINQSFSFSIGTSSSTPPNNIVNVESTDTMASIVTKINALSSTTGVTASYLKDDNSITFTTTGTGDKANILLNVTDPSPTVSNKLGITSGNITKVGNTYSPKFTASSSFTGTVTNAFSFDINNTSISINAGSTTQQILDSINAESSKTGVTASYSATDKSLIFTTTPANKNATIEITNTSTNELGIVDRKYTSSQTPTTGTPGSVEINGITYSVDSPTFTMDGVEFNIKAIGTTQIKLKQDEDAIFNSVKAFVDKYNDIIDKVNSKLTESTYRDFKPLLDEEKEALSEKQIEQWEDKAKSGLLRQESTLTNVLSQMRQSLSSSVTVNGPNSSLNSLSLSNIGITPGSYLDKGKLYIDETKLREAISQNGSDVMNLFTNSSKDPDSTTKYNQSGIAQRLYDQLSNTMSKLTDKAGSGTSLADNSVIGKMLSRINSDITSWQKRLESIEDRYWTKYTAMETAMSKASSQSSWLASQFS